MKSRVRYSHVAGSIPCPSVPILVRDDMRTKKRISDGAVLDSNSKYQSDHLCIEPNPPRNFVLSTRLWSRITCDDRGGGFSGIRPDRLEGLFHVPKIYPSDIESVGCTEERLLAP